MSIDSLQKAPGVVFVRVIYSLVALMKADYAIGTDAEGMGEVLDSKSLKVDYYLDTVLRMTTEAIGPQKCRIPSHWAFVLRQKLKAWHDEHQKWRREGGHLKRNGKVPNQTTAKRAKTEIPHRAAYAAQEALPAHQAPAPPLATPSSAPLSQPQQPLPNFTLNNPYPWPASNCPFPATTADHAMAGHSFGPDMTDFSAAFQNGDLYLWNDISDNFGGWIPQGGNLYSDMQFGTMSNQGM